MEGESWPRSNSGALTHEFELVNITHQVSKIAIRQRPTPALLLLCLLFVISNENNKNGYASSDTHQRTRIGGD